MRDDTLHAVLQTAFFTLMSNTHTAIPGRIVSYNKTTRLAEVQPIIKRKLENGQYEDPPILQSVPVIWPGTASAVIHIPLHKDDGCLILFGERALDSWIDARNTVPTAAADVRRFSYVDAICIPGLIPPQASMKYPTNDDALEIIYKGKSIVISGSEIDIGGSSKAFVTHAELNTALQTFITALNLAFATKLDGGGAAGALSIDISAAATTGVKTGG